MLPQKSAVHFEGLNLLRFAAAMMILLDHALSPEKDLLFWKLIHNLGVGVDFFFIISGFLISYLLLREKSYYKTVRIRDFYLRRILRIFPLYYLIILISFLVFYGHTTMHINYWQHLYFWGNFQTIKNHDWVGGFLTPLWSLCVEEHFYWVVPFLILVCPIKSVKYIYAGVILLSLGTKYYFAACIPANWFYIYCHTLSKVDVIAIGGLLACFQFEYPFRFNLSPFYSLICLAAIVLLLTFFDFNDYSTVSRSMFILYFINLPFVVFFCLFIFNDHPRILRIKRNHLFDYLGSISYGIYMFHMITLFCLSPWIPHHTLFERLLFVILISVVTIGFAAVSYRYIETPFLRMKTKFERVKTRPNESTASGGFIS